MNSNKTVVLPTEAIKVSFRFNKYLGPVDFEFKVTVNGVEVFAPLSRDKDCLLVYLLLVNGGVLFLYFTLELLELGVGYLNVGIA